MFIPYPPGFYQKFQAYQRKKWRAIIVFVIFIAYGIASFVYFIGQEHQLWDASDFPLPFFEPAYGGDIIYFGVFVILFMWVSISLQSSPQENLLLEKLSAEVLKRLPYKTIYSSMSETDIFNASKANVLSDEEQLSDANSPLSTFSLVEELLSAQHGHIDLSFVFEIPDKNEQLGFFSYSEKRGKSRVEYYLSAYCQPISKTLTSCVIHPYHLTFFAKSTPTGDSEFDNILKVNTNSDHSEAIISDIQHVGKEKILRFFKEKEGSYVVFHEQCVFWIRPTLFTGISYKNRDYHNKEQGIELQDEVIQRNIAHFKESLEKAQEL